MTDLHDRLGFARVQATAFALALFALSTAGCTHRKHHPSPAEGEPAATTSEEQVAAPIANASDCDTYLQTQESKAAAGKTCSPTEQLAFRKSPKCLGCLLHATCLDDQFGDKGNECEVSGTAKAEDDFAAGSPDEKQCLAVLACDFGLAPGGRPAPVHGGVNSGPLRPYCGDINVQNCWSAGPQGSCKEAITAGYPSSVSATAQQISLNIAQRKFPSGRAGAIVGCGDNNDCTACFQ